LLEEAIKAFTTENMQPQEQRAARAFALIALAGELATQYQITGWTEGAALEAALKCFEQWRRHRGVRATEDKVILEAIRDFIDRYGDTGFSEKNDSDNSSVKQERAGWYSDVNNDDRTYLFTSAGLKDATTGYDQKRVIEALTKIGWLTRDRKGHPRTQHIIQGRNNKLYAVTLGEATQ
jgi:putative DNA primase/helicase